MHGSVSLPSIDALVAEYVQKLGDLKNPKQIAESRQLLEDIYRRVGVENGDILIKQMKKTYRLLVSP